METQQIRLFSLENKLKCGWTLRIAISKICSEKEVVIYLEKEKGQKLFKKVKSENLVEALYKMESELNSSSCQISEDIYNGRADDYLKLFKDSMYLVHYSFELGFLAYILRSNPSQTTSGPWGRGETILVAIEKAIKETMHYTP